MFLLTVWDNSPILFITNEETQMLLQDQAGGTKQDQEQELDFNEIYLFKPQAG